MLECVDLKAIRICLILSIAIMLSNHIIFMYLPLDYRIMLLKKCIFSNACVLGLYAT